MTDEPRPSEGVALAVVGDATGAATALEASVTARGVRWIAVTADALADALASLTDDEHVVVAAVGAHGEQAVHVSASEGRIAALALIGAPLSPEAVQLLREWPELPVLAVADPTDRHGLRGAIDAYLASPHAASDVIVGPVDDAYAAAAKWLHERLTAVPRSDEVVLTSVDGWKLHATRWLPARPSPVPGVVLLHSGRSDRAVFARLERLLAERGLAVLNVDWRGRGQSTSRGTYMALSPDERAAGWRDAAAAFEHLAAVPEVDASRLGAVGVIHGGEHAVRAAQRDPRVRALVILTGYRPAEESEATYLTSGATDVMYVTSVDHSITTEAMRKLFDASTAQRARYLEYPGGAIGYQLFELDQQLEPAIVTWLAEALGA